MNDDQSEPAEPLQSDAAAPAVMMVDLTPGALACGAPDGSMEDFESIGELLEYLLRKYRLAEAPNNDQTGDFMAGYTEDAGIPQRQPNAGDVATARRM